MAVSPPHQAFTPLDQRIEAATGHGIEALWQYQERGLLDESTSRVADAHRDLAKAVTGVTFHRVLLARLASGEFEVETRSSPVSTAPSPSCGRPQARGTPVRPMSSRRWNPSNRQQEVKVPFQ
jgi:hypothetical protein